MVTFKVTKRNRCSCRFCRVIKRVKEWEALTAYLAERNRANNKLQEKYLDKQDEIKNFKDFKNKRELNQWQFESIFRENFCLSDPIRFNLFMKNFRTLEEVLICEAIVAYQYLHRYIIGEEFIILFMHLIIENGLHMIPTDGFCTLLCENDNSELHPLDYFRRTSNPFWKMVFGDCKYEGDYPLYILSLEEYCQKYYTEVQEIECDDTNKEAEARKDSIRSRVDTAHDDLRPP